MKNVLGILNGNSGHQKCVHGQNDRVFLCFWNKTENTAKILAAQHNLWKEKHNV